VSEDEPTNAVPGDLLVIYTDGFSEAMNPTSKNGAKIV